MRPCRITSSTVMQRQRGSSFVVVLILLSIIMLMGLVSTRLALFSERASRNDRDRQIAFQAAEAALLDAELDILGPNSSGSRRVCVFNSRKTSDFVAGCGTGAQTGMCFSATTPGEAWRSVLSLYVSNTGDSAANTRNQTVQYGQFTGQSLPTGDSGLPVRLPRYTIEAVPYAGTGQADDSVSSGNAPEHAFLVTAMGFGNRVETQVVLQTLIYKPTDKPNSGC